MPEGCFSFYDLAEYPDVCGDFAGSVKLFAFDFFRRFQSFSVLYGVGAAAQCLPVSESFADRQEKTA